MRNVPTEAKILAWYSEVQVAAAALSPNPDQRLKSVQSLLSQTVKTLGLDLFYVANIEMDKLDIQLHHSFPITDDIRISLIEHFYDLADPANRRVLLSIEDIPLAECSQPVAGNIRILSSTDKNGTQGAPFALGLGYSSRVVLSWRSVELLSSILKVLISPNSDTNQLH